MSFDEIPEDKHETQPCSECGNGNVTKKSNYWACDSCEFQFPTKKQRESVEMINSRSGEYWAK